MSESYLNKFEILDEQIRQIVYSVKACDLDVNNTFTRFLKLSESKFTEHVPIFINIIKENG